MNAAARSNGRLLGWLAFVAAFASLSYYGNFADTGAAELDEPLYDSSFFWSSMGGFGLMVFFAVLIAAGAFGLFALRQPRGWGRAIGISVAVLVAVFIVSAAVGQILDPGEEQGLLPEEWPPPDPGVFALNALAVVAGAPLAEELMFRGVGYSLLERFGPWVAIVASAFAWALAHGLVEAFPLIFVLGIGLGILRRETGSIVPGMVLHAVFNGIALAAAAASAAGN